MRFLSILLLMFGLHSQLEAQTLESEIPDTETSKNAPSEMMRHSTADGEKAPGEPDQPSMTDTAMSDGEEVEEDLDAQRWNSESFHTSTPSLIAEKLKFGFGLALGTGSGSSGKLSHDLVGSEVYMAFDLKDYLQLNLLPNSKDHAVFSYKNYSGIELESKKLSEKAVNVGVQAFVFSYGLEMPILDGMIDFMALAGLGILKESRLTEGAGSLQSSKFGGVIDLGGQVFYEVIEKIDAFVGLSLQVGTSSRYGLEFGLNGAF